jgi:hypothetical protein
MLDITLLRAGRNARPGNLPATEKFHFFDAEARTTLQKNVAN